MSTSNDLRDSEEAIRLIEAIFHGTTGNFINRSNAETGLEMLLPWLEAEIAAAKQSWISEAVAAIIGNAEPDDPDGYGGLVVDVEAVVAAIRALSDAAAALVEPPVKKSCKPGGMHSFGDSGQCVKCDGWRNGVAAALVEPVASQVPTQVFIDVITEQVEARFGVIDGDFADHLANTLAECVVVDPDPGEPPTPQDGDWWWCEIERHYGDSADRIWECRLFDGYSFGYQVNGITLTPLTLLVRDGIPFRGQA